MNKISFTLIIIAACFLFSPVKAQDPNAKLSEAESAYAAKNLDNTRFALQDALIEINKAIAKQILDVLPKNLGGLDANVQEDNVNGASGFAGIFVDRSYGKEPKTIKVTIMGDSPLLTSINAILSMPAMFGSSDPNQKRVKVGGYKSLLQKESGNSDVSKYTVQVPINQTLISISFTGYADENEVVTLAGTLLLDQIAQLSK